MAWVAIIPFKPLLREKDWMQSKFRSDCTKVKNGDALCHCTWVLIVGEFSAEFKKFGQRLTKFGMVQHIIYAVPFQMFSTKENRMFGVMLISGWNGIEWSIFRSWSLFFGAFQSEGQLVGGGLVGWRSLATPESGFQSPPSYQYHILPITSPSSVSCTKTRITELQNVTDRTEIPM